MSIQHDVTQHDHEFISYNCNSAVVHDLRCNCDLLYQKKTLFLNYTEKLKDRSFGHIADHLKSLKQPIKTKYSF